MSQYLVTISPEGSWSVSFERTAPKRQPQTSHISSGVCSTQVLAEKEARATIERDKQLKAAQAKAYAERNANTIRFTVKA